MKNLLFIMNPCAGKKKANKVLAEVLGIFNRAGYRVTVHITAGPGDGEPAVVQYAQEMDLVVCCGGDGTFNEVIAGVMKSGKDLPIGYIPAGSTNDFANSLQLSTDILQAARDIVEGEADVFDVGSFGGRYFSYVASFGAFTHASYATSQSLKNVLGHGAYLLSGITELARIKREHLKFELPGGRVVEDDFIFGAISNSTSVGGILTLAPDRVDMTDGEFELLLIRMPHSLAELSKCVMGLLQQKYDSPLITFLSATSVEVTAPEGMPWTLDGEREEGRKTVHVENLKHAVRVIRRRQQ